MALEPGTKLGPFRVTGPLGAGGMGEVYRATDTKLHREVAIKVLPEAFALDEQRMKRLEREAQLLASLNHPNIATVYGLEGNALVLELVEGATLADRIAEGPIPLDDALHVARQIVDALSEAHEKGIIHRDLKPANVKITEADQVKVLDFGLAKALAEEGHGTGTESKISQSPTLTRQATASGMILGTAAYMSPEQAKGKRLDRRTDVWAFGVVLYEMLTGRRAFPGEDVSETLAAVLRSEPDLDGLPPDTPKAVRRLLRRTLRKNPQERLADINDARLEIYEAVEKLDDPTSIEPEERHAPSLLAFVGLALVGLILGALAMWTIGRFGTSGPQPPTITRFALAVPLSDTGQGPPAWSPDGRSLVYTGSRDGVRQIFLRRREELELTPLRGTEGASYPFFSPDGEWVGFFADKSLKKVPIHGGPPQTLGPAGYRYGASWGPDGTIVFASSAAPGLMRTSALGGEPSVLTSPSGEGRHHWPQFLPGGKAILYTVSRMGPLSDMKVALLSLETGETRMLVEGTNAVYASTGHLVFGREASLWAVPFDLDRLTVTGTPVPVVEDVQVFSGGGLAQFALARDGTLAYWTAASQDFFLNRIDRRGAIAPYLEEARPFDLPRFSPDGKRIATELDGEIWTLDTARGALARLTVNGGLQPLWTPDGARITYVGPKSAIYWQRADGSGEAELLTTPDRLMAPGSWSPDGENLMLYGLNSPSQLYTFRKGGSIERFRPAATPFDETLPELSPDGRWLLYVSNETGRSEVYVQPYPGPGEHIPVSIAGGTEPVWSRDGREIFYRSRDGLIVASFDETASDLVGEPRAILREDFGGRSTTERHYDRAPDGQSFVVRTFRPATVRRELRIVLNWLSELEERVPVER